MLENKETICSNCETGRRDYELDKTSIFCSYIHCFCEGKCSKFNPMIKDTLKIPI